MVKRPKTPELASDGVLLAVVRPYPERSDVNFDGDGSVEITFVQWIGLFIPKEDIYAVYWRPEEIIMFVEVKKQPDGYYNKILGRHAWLGFLQTAPKDLNRESEVFFSTYNPNEAKKSGWRHKEVGLDWWEEDLHKRKFLSTPYPKPLYTDKNYRYCRPMPAPPSRSAAPRQKFTVGTKEWIEEATALEPSAPLFRAPAPAPPVINPRPAIINPPPAPPSAFPGKWAKSKKDIPMPPPGLAQGPSSAPPVAGPSTLRPSTLRPSIAIPGRRATTSPTPTASSLVVSPTGSLNVDSALSPSPNSGGCGEEGGCGPASGEWRRTMAPKRGWETAKTGPGTDTAGKKGSGNKKGSKSAYAPLGGTRRS